MALVGLLGALTIVTVATLWVLLKAATWQLQVDMAGGGDDDEATNAPRTLFEGAKTVWKTAIGGVLLLELWPGLSSWAYDAWYWILANVV